MWTDSFISLDRVFDPVYVSDLRKEAWRHFDDMAEQTADHWLALKLVSQRVANDVANGIKENLNF